MIRRIAPKVIRPRKTVTQDLPAPLAKNGERLPTEFGFVVKCFANNSFENEYHYFLPQASTPTMVSAKKDRNYWVLAGTVCFIHETETGLVSETHGIGEQISVPRGKVYRIATVGGPAELLVTQQVNYEKTLTVLNMDTKPVEVDSALLTGHVKSSASVYPRRDSSRAREQLSAHQERLTGIRAVAAATALPVVDTNTINAAPSQIYPE